METVALSPRRLKEAQRAYYWFNFFNVISFNFLSGNIITLYAIRLGLNPFLIGLLASFVPLAQVLPLLGRALVPLFGIVRLFGIFWLLRYILMLPILFTPLFVTDGNESLVLGLCVASVLGFNFAKGIGMTAHNPVLGAITTERDRGSFLARSQLVIHSGAIVTGLAIALLLGDQSPLYMYAVIISVGIVSGFFATVMIFKLPEPSETKKAISLRLFSHLIQAMGRKSFLVFIVLLGVSFFSIFMIQPFLIVFMKEVYSLGDNTVVYFTAIGSVGAVVMALLSGLMIDKLGAKPFIFIYAAVMTVMLLILIASPQPEQLRMLWVYGGIIFFLFMMGYTGIANGCNTYFFGLISAEERLNLGIFYFIATGLSGFLGSLIGGAVVEALLALDISPMESFRIYFCIPLCLFLSILFITVKLEKLGGYPIRDVLSIFLSPRDLRALRLLNRLERSNSQKEEQTVIHALGESQSQVTRDELLQRLKSPRFDIRSEALAALDSVPVDSEIAKALISEVRNHRFTTAYQAASMLGKKKLKEGIRVLRLSLTSKDYFLSGKSMVALAELDDRASIPEIRRVLEKTENPRLIIHAAKAMEVYKDTESIGLLIGKLEKKRSPFLRDEIILSLAGILGFGNWFYPHYLAFLEKSSKGVFALQDAIEEEQGAKGAKNAKTGGSKQHKRGASAYPHMSISQLQTILQLLPKNRAEFANECKQLLVEHPLIIEDTDITDALLHAVDNQSIVNLERFCFLLAAFLVWYAFHKE